MFDIQVFSCLICFFSFSDPTIILKEESIKKPCVRFANGECRFGGICRYSHYTEEQINELKQYGMCNILSHIITPK